MHPKVLIFPNPLSDHVANSLVTAGFDLHPLSLTQPPLDPTHQWEAAVVEISLNNEQDSWAMCRLLAQHPSELAGPVLVVIQHEQLHTLAAPNSELFNDFVVAGFEPAELAIRIRRCLPTSDTANQSGSEHVSYGPIEINVETYQATVSSRPLDLTFMEYQLLLFLTSRPGHVFSREVLLNQVWGYEYYGGARTVDVHIRRLRAKLGEENSQLIMTIRSVGYKLGEKPSPN